MNFTDLSVHRTKKKRINISDDYKTNLDYVRSNIKCHGSTMISNRLEKKNHHRKWRGINMDLEEFMNDLPELMHSIFINFVYFFLCLSCSAKIPVQHPKRLWIKSKNYNGRGGKMAEQERNEPSLRPVPNSPGITWHYRFNSAPSPQTKDKGIVFLFK